MPYSYYQLVRFIALVSFSYLVWITHLNKQNTLTIIYLVLALLFQPFFKIALGRYLWNIVDVIVSIFLITTWVIDLRNIEKIDS